MNPWAPVVLFVAVFAVTLPLLHRDLRRADARRRARERAMLAYARVAPALQQVATAMVQQREAFAKAATAFARFGREVEMAVSPPKHRADRRYRYTRRREAPDA